MKSWRNIQNSKYIQKNKIILFVLLFSRLIIKEIKKESQVKHSCFNNNIYLHKIVSVILKIFIYTEYIIRKEMEKKRHYTWSKVWNLMR